MEATTPRQAVTQMITSYWISQAIHVAAKLKLADRLQAVPRSSEDLAQETGTQPHALYRLLRALASVGVFAEDEQRRFGLTPLAEQLIEQPGSLHAVALMMGDEHYTSWGELLYSVQTGKTAFEHLYGKPVFEHLAEHPEQAKIFDAAMTGFHGPETQGMIDAYDFSGIGTLVDVGGGNGSLLSMVLKKYPTLNGILYDLPNVIDRAKANLASNGVADRCVAIPGSFFEAAPPGGDAYLMRHIIHDWNDEQCVTILRHLRKVIPPQGRLLVIEMVIQQGNGQQVAAKFLDLNMLVLPGGMERTEGEYRALFAKAGFDLVRIVPTPTEVSVVEGRPA